MHVECRCGTVMSDVASPGNTVHLLLNERAVERLQDLVDDEVKREGIVDLWPEHWERSGAVRVWKRHSCQRLHLVSDDPAAPMVVYAMEQTRFNVTVATDEHR